MYIVYRKIDLRSHLTYINSKACKEIDLIIHHVKYLNQLLKTCEKFRSSNTTTKCIFSDEN